MNGITLDIGKEEYQIIRAGLLELPAKLSHDLINKLDVQIATILKLQEKEGTK